MDRRLPSLPFPPDSPGIDRFLSHWLAVRHADALPTWTGASGLDADLIDGTAVLDVHEAKAKFQFAGDAFRRFFGFDVTGMDLMDLTVPQMRRARLELFQRLISQPCGCLYTIPWRSRRFGVADGNAILLPMRRHNADRFVLAGYTAFPRAIAAGGGGIPIVPRLHRMGYIDVGFGTPD
jgi:hypothetical protein